MSLNEIKVPDIGYLNEASRMSHRWARRNTLANEYNIETIRKKRETIPQRVFDIKQTLQGHRSAIGNCKEAMETIEADLMDEIANEKEGENGKLKYSNDTKRKNELTRKLSLDEGYKQLKLKLQEVSDLIYSIDSEIVLQETILKQAENDYKAYTAEVNAL